MAGDFQAPYAVYMLTANAPLGEFYILPVLSHRVCMAVSDLVCDARRLARLFSFYALNCSGCFIPSNHNFHRRNSRLESF